MATHLQPRVLERREPRQPRVMNDLKGEAQPGQLDQVQWQLCVRLTNMGDQRQLEELRSNQSHSEGMSVAIRGAQRQSTAMRRNTTAITPAPRNLAISQSSNQANQAHPPLAISFSR